MRFYRKDFIMETEKDFISMPRRLTAENGAKAAMIGEFSINNPLPCPDCDDSDDGICSTCGGSGTVIQKVNVPWTVIKEIYAKAVSLFVA
jgi:DnaJ-class molecular chaperone